MLNIKEVEKLTNITKQNIRYYERQGLIFPKRNPENDYREYSESGYSPTENNQNSTETGYANRRDSEIITS